MTTKYFQIGFNRCGTTSIHRFFLDNGIPSVHHDFGRLALAMHSNLRRGRNILTGYEGYRAFTDMEFLRPPVHIEGYKLYRTILEQVPDSRFILNIRDIDKWVESRLRLRMDREGRIRRALEGIELPCGISTPSHGDEMRRHRYADFYSSVYGLSGEDELIRHWKEDWYSHLEEVQRFVPQDRMLIFHVEADSPLALCRFADLAADAVRHYRQENFSLSPLGTFLADRTPDLLLRMTPKPVKVAVRRQLRRR